MSPEIVDHLLECLQILLSENKALRGLVAELQDERSEAWGTRVQKAADQPTDTP
jgi:hypothetical protein